jgi:leucyl-tRNA synthetase
MVHGRTFKDPSTQRFLKPEEVDASGKMNHVDIFILC